MADDVCFRVVARIWVSNNSADSRSQQPRVAEVAGAGFLVSRHQLVTCSHVVEEAIAANPHGKEVTIDFPGLKPAELLRARVSARYVTNDVAVLNLVDDLPSNVEQLPALDDTAGPQWGDKVRVIGFPTYNHEGVHSACEVRAPNATGWYQLDSTNSDAPFVSPGFSGSPVWDAKREVVIGMLVARYKGSEGRSAWMVPVARLTTGEEVAAHRGTAMWSSEMFRQFALTALINDLVFLEPFGLAEVHCDRVKTAIDQLRDAASGCSGPLGELRLHKSFAELYKSYDAWNGIEGREMPHRRKRRAYVEQIRDWRSKFSLKTGRTRGLAALSVDEPLFDQMWEALDKMSQLNSDHFPNVNRAVNQYRRRSGTPRVAVQKPVVDRASYPLGQPDGDVSSGRRITPPTETKGASAPPS